MFKTGLPKAHAGLLLLATLPPRTRITIRIIVLVDTLDVGVGGVGVGGVCGVAVGGSREGFNSSHAEEQDRHPTEHADAVNPSACL